MAAAGQKRRRADSDDGDSGRYPTGGTPPADTPPMSNTPMDLSPAAPSTPPATATATDPTAGVNDIDDLLRAAMVQALLPEAAPDHVLDHFLEAANWDVNLAVANFRAHRHALFNPLVVAPTASNPIVINSSTSNTPVPSPTQRRASGDSFTTASDESEDEKPVYKGRFKMNNEEQRRRLAYTLRRALKALYPNYDLSPPEAILLLVMNGWSTDAVLRTKKGTWGMRNRLNNSYDHMRLPIRSSPQDTDKDKKQQILQRDERLALLIDATGRSDWVSLREHLEAFDWNVVDAISSWFSAGIEPDPNAPWQNKPKQKKNEKTFRVGLRQCENGRYVKPPADDMWKAPAMDNEWAPDRSTFEPDEDEPDSGSDDDDDDDSDAEGQRLIRSDAKRQPGIEINEDLATAKVGQPNKYKLMQERIEKGKYENHRFVNKFDWGSNVRMDLFKGVRQDRGKLIGPFDWNNKDHVGKLNQFRRQNLRRDTQLLKRQGHQPWTDAENEFLYELNEEKVLDRMNATGKTRDEIIDGFSMSKQEKQEWADRFNQRFEGKTPKGADEPRRARKAAALMTQRNRNEDIIRDFRAARDEKYFEKKERAENNRKNGTSKTKKTNNAAAAAADDATEDEDAEQ
ncbi:hypothetical protein HRR83_000137 [Exophiala dermatitidis]|uniref:Uncharacterized protein n=1 Tax=Exophiala dermatitidis (strain ATCC 34100 / CBS 525.76 / NIH/UT8656) TaxID=858893 RepID=H6C8F0_EXODN|nr:uncharacterized protein HMPREF1120_08342 [Exophiala dermatitidis NIH/UT8656]KAJ4523491.1 hypothetical protein HRR73_002673 [Exophiala dermatitidis]EHY60377.1 hypothetical protein HMPREF1120_08342 [Exophiala dermatitidis NIH/UT8656]KAJ4527385.1 hypothetical protein HRR74_000138 [Exophiala dermatitidis]KAJ4549843.1 hypothetical protein HRR78_004653 [Exophiala dermatitidis]KAJ4581853.1 hypothetical protein HRR79_000858 [Exophiala dermatitidis]